MQPFTKSEAKMLQVLQNKRIAAVDVSASFPDAGDAMIALVKRNLARFSAGYYQITSKGREECPAAEPVTARKPSLIDVNKTAEVFEKTKQWQAKEFKPSHVVHQLIHKEKAVSENENTNELPRALQVLTFIENNPRCGSVAITSAFDFVTPLSYIKPALKNGQVIKTAAEHGKKKWEYSLAEGWTAEKIYAIPNKWGDKNKGKSPKNRADAAKPMPIELAPTESLQVINGELDTTTRFAFSSDKTLLILDGDHTIELDATATAKLREFYNEIPA